MYRKILLLFLSLCCCIASFGNITLASWNLQHFGTKKSDTVIAFVAGCLKDFDLVALQEINTANGAKAVALLVAELNRKGAQWDYCISDRTTTIRQGESERYAYLWKKAKVKCIGRPSLATAFEAVMSREPFIAVFKAEGREFTLVNFHAVPKKKQPEREIKYLKYFSDSLHLEHPVFLGDFNCPQSNTVFNPLKNKGYLPALSGQKTTLRQECIEGACLASEYDNIFYPGNIFRNVNAGILPFYHRFGDNMPVARKISDHLPVYTELSILPGKENKLLP